MGRSTTTMNTTGMSIKMARDKGEILTTPQTLKSGTPHNTKKNASHEATLNILGNPLLTKFRKQFNILYNFPVMRFYVNFSTIFERLLSASWEYYDKC